MPERFRAFLDRPLDPRAARAVLVLASAAFIGLAVVVLVGLGTGGSGRGSSTSARGEATTVPSSIQSEAKGSAKARASIPRQDPQDRSGTAAARAARGELRSHRALQHVPYRREDVSVTLVGAHGARAVLQVRARSVAAGRAAWHRFLRRFGDTGRAYRPIFEVRGGGR